jgi:hypothetical protein
VQKPTLARAATGAAVGSAIAVAGGAATGWLLNQVGDLGAIALWGVGAAAGFCAKARMGGTRRQVGWILVAACVLALPISAVVCIRFGYQQGEEGWWASVTYLPALFQRFKLFAFIAAVSTFFGAMSAYAQTARRYIVYVADD